MNSIKHPTHASPSGTITWELTYFPGASEADFFAWKPENLPSSPWLEAKVPGAPQTTPGFGLPYPEILYRKNWESVRWMVVVEAIPKGGCVAVEPWKCRLALLRSQAGSIATAAARGHEKQAALSGVRARGYLLSIGA